MTATKIYSVLSFDNTLIDVHVPAKFEVYFLKLTRSAYLKGKPGLPINEYQAWLDSMYTDAKDFEQWLKEEEYLK